jgi:hypothetical protein
VGLFCLVTARTRRIGIRINPQGWQILAGGRSVTETPGGGLAVLHPEGMPEVCDPSGVDGGLEFGHFPLDSPS